MKWRLLAVACVLLALGLLLYPLLGELVSERYHSDVETVYTTAIAGTDDAELAFYDGEALLKQALNHSVFLLDRGEPLKPVLQFAKDFLDFEQNGFRTCVIQDMDIRFRSDTISYNDFIL